MIGRVALVSEHASPLARLGQVDAGGQNVYVACLAAALADRGHQVDVYTRRDDPSLPDIVHLRRGVTVVHVEAGPARPIDKDHLFPHMDEFAGELVDHLLQARPDVLHSHFWMSGYAARLAAYDLGLPHVHTFHALGAVKRRHQGAADHSPPERDAEERTLLRAATAVVATCRDELAELEALGAQRQRVEIVPCGFDAAVFTPHGPALPRTGRARLSAVSRLVPRKGLGDVFEALSLLPDVELVVAGGGPDGDPYLDQLRELAASLRIEDRVQLAGGVTPHVVAALHRSSDVFVAAPWYEPFGIAPVEAMGCGLPVVGTAVGGLLDTVVPGSTGVLVAPRDAEAIASAVRWLLAEPVVRRGMGAAATRRAHRDYPWSVVAAAMDGVYERAAARAGAGMEVYR